MINVLLIDDHNIVRNGIKTLIEINERFKVVAEASNGSEAMRCLEKFHIDLVVLDINLDEINGLQILRQVKNQYPEIRVIILSMHAHQAYLFAAFQEGCDAYLLKNINADELVFALKFVYQGNKYLCAELTFTWFEAFLKTQSMPVEPVIAELQFSERELEILQLIADGLTNQEMSEKLFLSKRTIEGHRQSLLDKTASRNSAVLIRYAVKHGLID